jgi:hypothetical protein
MIYPPDYFDNCNGLIPQIVYCIALLQAGNEKQQQYNGLLKDVTDSAQFSVSVGDDGVGYLNLTGWLPLAESRYLLNRQSLVERVSALNSYNVALVADSVGLPFAGVDRASLNPVALPVGINHLTDNELVIETRLAYLLYSLEKRTNLYRLYNLMRYLYLVSLVSPIQVAANGTTTVLTTVIYNQIVKMVLNALFRQYPEMERLIFGTIGLNYPPVEAIDSICTWLDTQLNSSNPPYIPAVDPTEFIQALADEIVQLKQYTFPVINNIIQVAGSDVSSEITTTNSSSNSDTTDNSPLSFYGSNQSSSESPFAPTEVGSSISSEEPLNTLPEC